MLLAALPVARVPAQTAIHIATEPVEVVVVQDLLVELVAYFIKPRIKDKNTLVLAAQREVTLQLAVQ
jgi:hypothetical protein